MVTDEQVRLLMSELKKGRSLTLASAKAGMDRKTARKYRDLERLPSEVVPARTWRTRRDPFDGVWESRIVPLLETNPGLEAKTIFGALQREEPGRFADGQLRTLQRKMKRWRASAGPAKEVFFPQEHRPGERSQSDFTYMAGLGITIRSAPFDHLLYHFVLTYSNWETGSICFSESFESLSAGLQGALWKLGGVPRMHQTDRLSAAVQQLDDKAEFTRRYNGLLDHYGLVGRRIQAGKANENGDVEQSNHRLKTTLDQALMLRGSRDFESREEYAAFLDQTFEQLNSGRKERFEEDRRELSPLPKRRLDTTRRIRMRVRKSSTLRIQNNTYSVDSRLIGEEVEARIYAEHIEVWYAQRQRERLPRLRGRGRHHVDYRHIIDWLVRKPGAFASYSYRESLFPSSRFRMAYDELRQRTSRCDQEYLKILDLAAKHGETRVERSISDAIDAERPITFEQIEQVVTSNDELASVREVEIDTIDLASYDELLAVGEVN